MKLKYKKMIAIEIIIISLWLAVYLALKYTNIGLKDKYQSDYMDELLPKMEESLAHVDSIEKLKPDIGLVTAYFADYYRIIKTNEVSLGYDGIFHHKNEENNGMSHFFNGIKGRLERLSLEGKSSPTYNEDVICIVNWYNKTFEEWQSSSKFASEQHLYLLNEPAIRANGKVQRIDSYLFSGACILYCLRWLIPLLLFLVRWISKTLKQTE